MNKSYINRFQKFYNLLSDSKLACHARLNERHTFSRTRKMPLKDMLLCCLSKKGLTTSFELRNYLKEKDLCSMSLSKQGYLQQRKRLNPQIFSYLNKEYLTEFYSSSEPECWNDYLLFAIDGSKTEVPNSKENRQTFGNSGNQHSETGQVRALVSGLYDILNHFYLDIEIAHISVSENELAKQNIMKLKEMGMQQSLLIIFDRGYPSLEFVDFLEKQEIQYLFRLSSNDYISERKKMLSEDEIVCLQHSYQRLQKIRKKHPKRYESMKTKGKTTVRIVRSILPSGNELVLMTNLSKKITAKDLVDLYYQRWEIEKQYHTLKNKMKFESITSKSSIYVYQDFGSQILVYNMIQDIRKSADIKVSDLREKKKYKHPMRTNENIAIGLFKESMIKLFLELGPKERKKKAENFKRIWRNLFFLSDACPIINVKKICQINIVIIKRIVFKRSIICHKEHRGDYGPFSRV